MSSITTWLVIAITLLTAVAGVVALIHAVLTRADAFPAVDAKSKGFWVAVLAVSTFATLFYAGVSQFFGPLALMIFVAAAVAICVYLAEWRPRLDAVQGKSWFRKAA